MSAINMITISCTRQRIESENEGALSYDLSREDYAAS